MKLFNYFTSVFKKDGDKDKDEFEIAECNAVNTALDVKVSKIISENKKICGEVFKMQHNFDVILREFEIRIGDVVMEAFLIFYDAMSNKEIINLSILQPLMGLRQREEFSPDSIADVVYKRIISQSPIKKSDDFNVVMAEVAFGSCAIFVAGCEQAFIADVKGWARRGVDKPLIESVLSGPQEAFTESIITNVGLVRKILKDANLIAENIPIGLKSHTACAMFYIQNIANPSLVEEVRRRLKNVRLDNIYSSGELEQLIEDKTFSFAPQILTTERPDRAASMIAEGRIVLILDGSPLVLVVPAALADFTEASEDNYVRFTAANLSKIVRIFGMLLSLLLPGIFIAITTFHSEMIPSKLLFSVESTRENVPFPIVIELLLMEFAFELIREASIRVPNSVGSTLGIIGALILGQAAVAANIVSPILILVTAVAGIGLFATPNVSLSRSISIAKFFYIILGAICGFLGISLGLFINGLMLTSSNSFGVPFLSPLIPSGQDSKISSIFVSPIWKREKRPSALKTQNSQKQPKISRNW